MSAVENQPAEYGHPWSASQRLMWSLAAGCGLFGMSLLYAAVMRPITTASLIDTSSRRAIARPDPGPSENEELAATYLPDHPWAAASSKRLSTDDAVFYFQRWETVDTDAGKSANGPTAVNIAPFAMIWFHKGRASGVPPITVVADEAYVHFSNPVSISSDPGKVVDGRLEGNVEIRGPDRLSLHGRDVFFQEKDMQVWCDSDVSFTYKANEGTAKGMEAKLIRDPEAQRQGKLGVSGVANIKLLTNVEMNLVSQRRHKDGRINEQESTVARIRSRGSFSLDVANNVASFDYLVSVLSYRPDKPNNFDQLLCDLLTIGFSRNARGSDQARPGATKPQTPERVPTGVPNRTAAVAGDFKIEWLSATCRPGHVVEVRSTNNKIHATTNQLLYDARTKVAQLISPEATPVHVIQETNDLYSPFIELLHDDDSQITHAVCRGPGRMTSLDAKTGAIQLAAQWRKELRKFPEPQSMLDIIELEQDAVVHQPIDNAGVAADTIRIWIDRPRKKDKRIPPPDKSAAGPVRKDEPSMRPRRMVATNNVTMTNADLNIATNRLEVWIEAMSAALMPADSPQSRPVRPASVAGKRAAPATAAAEANRDNTASTPGAEAAAAKKPAPVKVQADLVRVLVVQDENAARPGAAGKRAASGASRLAQNVRVSEVWVNGNVVALQPRRENQPPVHLTGTSMHIVNYNPDEPVVHVFGQPAHVRDDQMHIEGNTLHINRAENLAWVDGPGLVELPVREDLQGKPLSQPELLSVWWKEQMIFDGDKATFLGDARTELRDSRMRCQEMQAILNRPYSFTDAGEQEDVAVQSILCREGVEFENREYEQNRLMRIRHGKVDEFSLNQLTGETLARGPGNIVSWERGAGRRTAITPAALVQANKASQPQDLEWEFSSIQFSGKMIGSTKSHFTEFHDRVKVIYGPVKEPLEYVNPDVHLPENGALIKSSMVRVEQRKLPGTDDTYVQLYGQGNAEIEGKTFHGQADKIAFDESKGDYTLISDGNQTATLWRQTKAGEAPTPVYAQRIDYTPSIPKTVLDRVTGLEGLQQK